MQFAGDPNQNPFKGSTVFSRRITVIQGRVRLCDEFSSGDRMASCFWIVSSYEVICKRCFERCESLVCVISDADTKVSRFEGYAFCESGLTSIHIPSSVEVICEGCCYRCQLFASVTRDPSSKLRPTLSRLLAGVGFEC
jgi:hypothetical protein